MNLDKYRDLNHAMSRAWNKCQYALDMAGIKRGIDEMSVLLTEAELNSYKEWAAVDSERGFVGGLTRMEWFNRVERDLMQMERENGDGPSFQVRFEFFRPRMDLSDREALWRVEAMAVLEGFAPLHRDPTCRVVHASYKCSDMADYEQELVRLVSAGMTPVAHYRNTYGRFSYFENPEFPWGAEDRPIYLKPRVNLRDTTA
jgi:hypothetical protein